MNLQKLFEDFSKRRSLWDYYERRGNITFPNSLLNDDIQEERIMEECSSFIQEYVVLSEKGENNLFQDWKLILDGAKIKNQYDINNQKLVSDGLQKVQERSKHIVSTFFLGLILYNEIHELKDSIIKEMQKIPFYKKMYQSNSIECAECERQFIFLWFMASLFHDLGYRYEASQVEEDCLKLIKRVADSKIWSDYRNYKLRDDHIPISYSIQTCKCYFNCYRWHESKKIDHGITAACMLYDSLCKIRKEKCKKPDEEKDGEKDYSWDIGLKKVYYVISWIILVHNIWFSSDLEIEEKKNGETENQRKKYELYHLNSLIKKKEDVYPIQYDEYPLLFLFCLVDSIEPLKRNIPLSMIELDFKDKAIEITIQGCSDKAKSYIKGLTDLKYWLTKTVEGNDDKIRIVLDNTNQLIA